jgi:heme/copper-type cytochrome/quinol oxidase subunit 4
MVKKAGLRTEHHHVIMMVLMLAATVLSIGLGVRIAGAAQGTEGLLILVFALSVVNVVISLLLFTQFMHLRK